MVPLTAAAEEYSGHFTGLRTPVCLRHGMGTRYHFDLVPQQPQSKQTAVLEVSTSLLNCDMKIKKWRAPKQQLVVRVSNGRVTTPRI
jgi:hypothetical protein